MTTPRLAGSKNPNWKGGRYVGSNGYVRVLMPDHPEADSKGYVYEHRIVAERKLGRPLMAGEIAHHVNGDKADNRDENIEVVAGIATHLFHHRTRPSGRRRPNEPNVEIQCGCGCGVRLSRYDSCGRPRRFVTGHNMMRRTA